MLRYMLIFSCKDTQKVMGLIGHPKNSLFGVFWDFTVHTIDGEDGKILEHSDTAYTNVCLRSHSDGCYSVEPPGYV
jgi:hypothetical protein